MQIEDIWRFYCGNTHMTSDETHKLIDCITVWGFDHNEGMSKKIRKHHSFKEYWNEGYQLVIIVIIANTDWVTTLLVCNT